MISRRILDQILMQDMRLIPSLSMIHVFNTGRRLKDTRHAGYQLSKEETILEEEHKMVKNYLLGNFLTMIDGPYNTADVIKTFITEGLDIEHFNELIQYIIHFRPVDMQEAAKKYLNADQMWEVTVGGK